EITLKINGINISQYGASLSEKLITPTSFDTVLATSKRRLSASSINEVPKRLYLKILFQGNTRDIIENNISNFTTLISKEFDIEFDNKIHKFHCFPSFLESEETGFNDMLYLYGDVECYEYSDEIVEYANKVTTKTIQAQGNKSTPCILEITPSIDIIDLIIEGVSEAPITIKNLKANKKFILDGEKFKATIDNINKFSDVDLWEFPGLSPGVNNLKFSRNNCNITIKYKPMWI
ncbi:MAG: phage distal tail protein, partial [Clostridium sp.]